MNCAKILLQNSTKLSKNGIDFRTSVFWDKTRTEVGPSCEYYGPLLSQDGEPITIKEN